MPPALTKLMCRNPVAVGKPKSRACENCDGFDYERILQVWSAAIPALSSKSYVESQVPLIIKRRCKGWIEADSDAIRQLLQQISASLAEGLGREFDAGFLPSNQRVCHAGSTMLMEST